jgi:hypothetical protein
MCLFIGVAIQPLLVLRTDSSSAAAAAAAAHCCCYAIARTLWVPLLATLQV